MKVVVKRGVGDNGERRAMAARKLDETVDFRACGDDCCAVELGVTGYYLKRLGAYRACGSDNGYFFAIVHFAAVSLKKLGYI